MPQNLQRNAPSDDSLGTTQLPSRGDQGFRQTNESYDGALDNRSRRVCEKEQVRCTIRSAHWLGTRRKVELRAIEPDKWPVAPLPLQTGVPLARQLSAIRRYSQLPMLRHQGRECRYFDAPLSAFVSDLLCLGRAS